MKSVLKFGLITGLSASFLWIGLTAAGKSQNQMQQQTPSKKTIGGLVRDIACPIQNKESTSRKFNLECAKQCAKQGSPLAILTDDGTLYFPISEGMPDTDQRARLLPFLGEYVSVTGETYERGGTHAIVIREIKEDKSVHLTPDAFHPE
jgi:hypothetical protein